MKAAARAVRPQKSFHTASALNMGQLQGINCAQSLYPYFHPRSQALDSTTGLRPPATSPWGPPGTSLGRSSALIPRFQDGSLCQYWIPLKWFLGTCIYRHLSMNTLQSMIFASQGHSLSSTAKEMTLAFRWSATPRCSS